MSQKSTGLKNQILADLAVTLTGVAGGATAGTGSGHLKIYGGTVPADISAGVGAATLIGSFVDSAHTNSPLSFAAPSGGVMAKNAGETWSMTVSGLGAPTTATFGVFYEGSDDITTSSGTAKRLLVTIAAAGSGAADWIMANPVFSNADVFVPDVVQINAPL